MSDKPARWNGEPSPSALGQLVRFEPTAAQLEREWAAVESRVARSTSPRRWLAYAAVAALALLVGGLARGLLPSPPSSASWEGTTIESAAGAQIVRLPDGAEVRAAPESAVRVAAWTPERVTLELERGEVTVEVPHLAGRTWTVAAGAFDVQVVGTRFVVRRSIAAGGEDVSVEVLRGRVEVVRRGTSGEPRVLIAGESWRAEERAAGAPTPAIAATPPATAAAPPAIEAGASSASPGPDQPPDEPADAPETPAAASAPAPVAAPGWEELARIGRHREAYDVLGSDGFGSLLVIAGPERLLRMAEMARGSGHVSQAAKAFDALRRKYPGDRRAGLAAFELGRLRMDSLGNPAGAAEAFADAIALSPGAPFREDAEARRVLALHASRAAGPCVAARDAYLARYPAGAHAATVRTRCSSR